MTEEEVIELIKELEIEIDALKAQIADMEKGTSEYETAVEELDTLETDKEEACEFHL